MSQRTVIVSDTHLGRPHGSVGSADAMRPLWQGVDRLIINGDAAEVHHPIHRAAAARQILRLVDLCDADGVTLTLLSGNHDPYLSETRHLSLAGGAVFVTHGDVLHPSIVPWSPAAPVIRQAHREARAVLRTWAISRPKSATTTSRAAAAESRMTVTIVPSTGWSSAAPTWCSSSAQRTLPNWSKNLCSRTLARSY